MRLSDSEISSAITKSRSDREPTVIERQVRSLYSRGLPLSTIIRAFGLRVSQLIEILGLNLDPMSIDKLEQETESAKANE